MSEDALNAADKLLEDAVDAGDLLLGIVLALTPDKAAVLKVSVDDDELDPADVVRFLIDAGAKLGEDYGINVAVFNAGGQG